MSVDTAVTSPTTVSLSSPAAVDRTAPAAARGSDSSSSRSIETPAGDRQNFEGTDDGVVLEGALRQRLDADLGPDRDDARSNVPAAGEDGDSAGEEREESVRELQFQDQQTRLQSATRLAVAGPFADLPRVDFEQGPDGRRFAVDAQARLDLSPVADNPQATIDKMRIVRAAALATPNPSQDDRQVALEAARLLLEARFELIAEQMDNADSSEADAFRAVAGLDDPQLAERIDDRA